MVGAVVAPLWSQKSFMIRLSTGATGVVGRFVFNPNSARLPADAAKFKGKHMVVYLNYASATDQLTFADSPSAEQFGEYSGVVTATRYLRTG